MNAASLFPSLKKLWNGLKNIFLSILGINLLCFAGIEDIDFTPNTKLYNKVYVAPKNKLLVIRCNVCGKWRNIAVKSIGETSDHILLVYNSKKSQKVIRSAFFFYYVKDTVDIRKCVILKPRKTRKPRYPPPENPEMITF